MRRTPDSYGLTDDDADLIETEIDMSVVRIVPSLVDLLLKHLDEKVAEYVEVK